MSDNIDELLTEIRACRICADKLQLGPRPVLQIDAHSKILIAGQAPGARVHKTGVPFDDPSGERLRDWMGIDRDTFYDPTRIAILPMGFCYPGKGKSGDLPPRPECAEKWRSSVLSTLDSIRLTLVIGKYAQQWHLDKPGTNLTETVKAWRKYGPDVVPLPHPSPRNNIWLSKNRWFEKDLIPALQTRVRAALKK